MKEEEEEEEEWEEDTMRYDRVGELKTETRFCGEGGAERKHRGLVIRASSRRGEYIAIIYINTVDAVTINSCSHEGIEWNIKFPGGSKPRGGSRLRSKRAPFSFSFFLSFFLSSVSKGRRGRSGSVYASGVRLTREYAGNLYPRSSVSREA